MILYHSQKEVSTFCRSIDMIGLHMFAQKKDRITYVIVFNYTPTLFTA